MLATSYLLAFQSGYLEDGFLEHVLAFRGCASLSQLILANGMSGPFAVQANYHKMTSEVKTHHLLPRLDQEIACEALRSISEFSHLIEAPAANAIEKAVVAQLVEAIRGLLETKTQPLIADDGIFFTDNEALMLSPPRAPSKQSPTDSYLHLIESSSPADPVKTFSNINWDSITTPPSPCTKPDHSLNALMSALGILFTWPQDALLHLFSPTNQPGNIVMAHFLAIRLIIQPLSAPRSSMRTPVRAMIQWIAKVTATVDEDEDQQWRQYVQWPRKVLKCLQACAEKNPRLTLGHICHVLNNDPGAFTEGRLGRA
ncbi:Nn.00g086970.m01.CDS01 [Neocucurbitaria sp. VM-36]